MRSNMWEWELYNIDRNEEKDGEEKEEIGTDSCCH